MKRACVIITLMALFFCAPSCSKVEDPEEETIENNENDGNAEDSIEDDDPSGTGKDEDIDTSGDSDGDTLLESDFKKIITIVWNGDDATITNGTSLNVTKNGAHVVIGEPAAEGVKVRINLSGSSSNGSLKIYNGVKANDTNKKMLLSFEGLSLTSKKGPAISIQSGKTVYVLLKDGTSNTLCDTASYTDIVEGEDAKGCFFSEKQLCFSGNGKLVLDGKSKHAICVDDYIHIFSGEIQVKSAISDGIHTNDYVQIDGGRLDINSTGESIQCENLESGYFYMKGGDVTLVTSAAKCGCIETASDLIIEGGNLTATANGAASKCLKSGNNVTISGGTIILKTTGSGMYDMTEKDTSGAACIRAENNVILKGGEISCTSTGNGGKGINCYSFESNEGTRLTVSTSGSVYSYSSSLKSRPKAIKATKLVTVNGGVLDIKTTGTEGEGIESKDAIVVNGGTMVINAKDDGINAAGTITFNGGYTYVYSTSNDGIDTNYGRANSIVINGGVVISHAAGGAEEGFDADNHAYLTFNGGFVFCTGGQQGGGGGGGGRPGSGGNFGSNPSCDQPCVMYNAAATKGYFTVCDSTGKVIMSFYVPRNLSTNYSMISGPLKSGSSYRCGFTTSAPSGAKEVFGTYFYSDGSASSLSKTFTAPSAYGNI